MDDADATKPHARDDRPISLTGHDISNEQIALIQGHVQTWSRTALQVSDRLPLGADSTDVFRALKPEDAQ